MFKDPLYFDIMTDILNCQLKFAILFLFLIRSGYRRKREWEKDACMGIQME